MTRAEIQAEIVRLQAQVALIDSIPSDTFPFGTIVVFSPQQGSKSYYIKTGEESWRNLKLGNGTDQKTLAEWILKTKDSPIGYFEVYVMSTAEIPFYASN